MGLMRKMTSLSTGGIIDWRNDSERIAAAERSKARAMRYCADMERELAERELALRKRELELAERQAGIEPPPEPESTRDLWVKFIDYLMPKPEDKIKPEPVTWEQYPPPPPPPPPR